MSAHIVRCRICKQPFEPDPLTKGVNWIEPSPRWYYHLNCYNTWKTGQNLTDDDWVELIYDFLARDLKVSYDYWKCEAQRKKYIKQNSCTNKGIYFALKYFYEIQHNDWNAGHEGIGIIPYIYGKAAEYWENQELKRRGTIEEIEKQIAERHAREGKTVGRRQTNKKPKWNQDDI